MNNELFIKTKDRQTRWASFENPLGLKGKGGMDNNGAKGHANERFEAGETKILLDTEGPGIINAMWFGISQESPEILRSIKLEMFWDHEEKPAVSVPFPDFFCAMMGRPRRFESVFFSNPEGRSYNSFVKMPFVKHARITVTNESDQPLKHIFYDVKYTLMPLDANDILYFHAFWNRENPTRLTRDYTILPKQTGKGVYAGMNMSVRWDERYARTWFGEGEVKFYIDGDGEHPTLCGTGTEDYIGTAWGQGEFNNMTQGCLIADRDNRMFSFYRFHTYDPVYFDNDIVVQIQSMGGQEKYELLKVMENGAPIKIVTADQNGVCVHLYEQDFILDHNSTNCWYNYYHEMDYTSTAYFYLDKPSSDLPSLPSLAQRIDGLY